MASDKAKMIKEYISLNSEYQNLYLKYKIKCEENEKLLKELASLKNENTDLEKQIQHRKENLDNSTLKENKSLLAQLNQLKRVSTSHIVVRETITPNNSSISINDVFEVHKLVKHRGRKGQREFLIRWRNYSSKNDTWEKQQNLSCPHILQEYMQKHKLK